MKAQFFICGADVDGGSLGFFFKHQHDFLHWNNVAHPSKLSVGT